MSTPASRQYSWTDDAVNGIDITASRMDGEFDAIITKLNQKAIIQSSAPTDPIAGMLWYDTTNKLLKQYRNAEWVSNGIVHVSSTEPTTMQAGDIWIDTSGSEIALKARNLANDAWITAIYSDSPFLVPSGGIIAWSGSVASIPTGWVLCNGSNSTPDLRDRFIIGAGNTYNPGDTGGSTTKDLSHTHSVSNEGWGEGVTPASGRLLAGLNDGGAASTTNGVTTGSGGSTTQDIMPPYYALCYIQKT